MTTNNYHIALYDRHGAEITTRYSPRWYGITADTANGIALGMVIGYAHKTATARVCLLNDDDSKGELVRVQH